MNLPFRASLSARRRPTTRPGRCASGWSGRRRGPPRFAAPPPGAESLPITTKRFFASHGGLFAGLGLADTRDVAIERAPKGLAALLGRRVRTTPWEEPPPERAVDLVAAARAAKGPRLVDGKQRR